MKALPLTDLVEASKPGTVNYEITVNWPDHNEPSAYYGIGLTMERALETLEVLVDELRAALKPSDSEVRS